MARGQRLPKDHGDTVKKSHPPSVVRDDIAEINPKRKIMADAILEGRQGEQMEAEETVAAAESEQE